MKKFLKYFLIFLLPIAIAGVSMELLLRNIPNVYRMKKEYLDTNANDIHTLVLGSSHAFRGINPQYFTEKTYNASYVSQSLKYDYFIFERYKDKLKNLKVLIIPISYFSYTYDLKNSIESWRIVNYVLYYGFKNTEAFKYYFEIFSNTPKINFKKIVDYYIKGKNNLGIDNNGFGIMPMKEEDVEKDATSAVQRHTAKDTSFVRENTQYLDAIISECHKKGIIVLLVTLPAHESYRVKLDSLQMGFVVRKSNEFAEKYNNCFYYNFIDDTSFTKKDFYNSDHLNKTGAEKISVKLNNILTEILKQNKYADKKSIQ